MQVKAFHKIISSCIVASILASIFLFPLSVAFAEDLPPEEDFSEEIALYLQENNEFSNSEPEALIAPAIAIFGVEIATEAVVQIGGMLAVLGACYGFDFARSFGTDADGNLWDSGLASAPVSYQRLGKEFIDFCNSARGETFKFDVKVFCEVLTLMATNGRIGFSELVAFWPAIQAFLQNFINAANQPTLKPLAASALLYYPSHLSLNNNTESGACSFKVGNTSYNFNSATIDSSLWGQSLRVHGRSYSFTPAFSMYYPDLDVQLFCFNPAFSLFYEYYLNNDKADFRFLMPPLYGENLNPSFNYNFYDFSSRFSSSHSSGASNRWYLGLKAGQWLELDEVAALLPSLSYKEASNYLLSGYNSKLSLYRPSNSSSTFGFTLYISHNHGSCHGVQYYSYYLNCSSDGTVVEFANGPGMTSSNSLCSLSAFPNPISADLSPSSPPVDISWLPDDKYNGSPIDYYGADLFNKGFIGSDVVIDGDYIKNRGTVPLLSPGELVSIKDWTALQERLGLHVTDKALSDTLTKADTLSYAGAQATTTVGTAVSTGSVKPVSRPTLVPVIPLVDFSLIGKKLGNKFPFCIPQDLGNLFACFVAAPVAPSFTWVFATPVGTFPLYVSLSQFDPVAAVCREVFAVLLLVGLCFAVFQLIQLLRGAAK